MSPQSDKTRIIHNTGFQPATEEQQATAALAGWRVVLCRGTARFGIEWEVIDPDGYVLNRYHAADEAWAAAWALCDARSEAAEVGKGAKGRSSWWQGWKQFREDQAILRMRGMGQGGRTP